VSPEPPPPDQLYLRDLLHWRRTGTFLRVLVETGQASGDLRREAYAYGYLTSYAGKVCGSPFVNSIVGGPYRTQWWRHRYINNHVDAWVFGHYEHDPHGTPGPADPGWAGLCDAKLHRKLSKTIIEPTVFEVKAQDLPPARPGDPDPVQTAMAEGDRDPVAIMDVLRGKQTPSPWLLDKDFCTFWFESMRAAYGDLLPGRWIMTISPERQQTILTFAFLRAWMVLWFQTGTGIWGLGCPFPMPAVNRRPIVGRSRRGWSQTSPIYPATTATARDPQPPM
jgi:hypothetical protein